MKTETYRLINQSGVKQACFPMDGTPYCACWDGLLTPDGRVYIPAASELSIGEYVRMYEYTQSDNQFTELFYSKDVVMAPERTLTSSKFHFSLDVMEDGRIIGTTHTTDRAPSHPTWLFKQYYHHIWEGYPGSSLVIFDPKTNTPEHLGVIVPRETIYGGVYSAKDQSYYCLGLGRGHLYRYSFRTRRVTDFGQVTEGDTFGIHVGPDSNIYFATRTGFLFKIDVEKEELIDLNFEISHTTGHPGDAVAATHKSIACAVNIPDSSTFIFTVFSGEGLYSHDTTTGKTEYLGRLLAVDKYCENFDGFECSYGLALDRDNVLWYALTSYAYGSVGGDYTARPGASLMRWDVLRGGKPECLGMLGTPDRAIATAPALMFDTHRDLMYIVGTNHGSDGLSVLSIDMKKYRPEMDKKGPPCTDEFLFSGASRYREMEEGYAQDHLISSANTPFLQTQELIPVKLWRSCKPEHSRVMGLAWFDETTLCGVCGDLEPMYAFSISDQGKLLEFKPLDDVKESQAKWLQENMLPGELQFEKELELPSCGGRRYKAVASAVTKWNGGREIVGTLDGMLSVVDGDSVFSLGSAVPNGPVHCLAVDQDQSVCYGVGGDPESLGSIFRYDDKNGLKELGTIFYDGGEGRSSSLSTEFSSIVVNPVSGKLAIGARDRLGVVYIVTL
jgi:hypothetical protein